MTTDAGQSDLLAAYLAGGLSPDERGRLETRLAADPALAAQLESLMALDLSLKQSAGVDAILTGLEDRLTAAIEASKPLRRFAVHPMVRKAALATAACLLLGTTGYFASTAMDDGKLPLRVRDSRSVATLNTVSGFSEQVSFGRVSGNTSGPGQAGALATDSSGVIKQDDYATLRDRWFNYHAGYVPDFSDAPSFSLSGPTADHGGGGGKGNLFAANKPVADPYAPGSNLQPFKPGQNTYNGATVITGGTIRVGDTDGQNVLYADGHHEFAQTPLTGTPSGDTYPRGTQVNGGTSTMAGAVSTNGPISGKSLEASVVESLKKRVDPAGSGTLTLGGQTLAGDEDGDGKSKPTILIQKESEKKDFPVLSTVVAEALGENNGKLGVRAGVNQNGGIPATQPTAVAPEVRKIIRSGELVYEVDRFDSAAATIGKIVTENGGLVATTNSDKLPNGKVRGEIIVRVPPDKLDTFILQLRALGDLKSQRLGSADVSKEYYDLESDLRAGRAMETRLLDMIKNGKGEIKDLLEAEKELANWRGKIEKIIGQQKYYDNLVSLATLTITLQERDIATPAAAVENESITAGVETDDVEKARTMALEILKDAKARIISSDLKKLDAGQVASTIVADIPPDGSGAVVDRIKQLGKVARLESTRSMTADPNASSTSPSPKLERKDSRLTLSLYNVANVQPRQTTTMELATTDVSATYNAIAAKALKAGGRVVRGGATQGRGNTSQADGVFEVSADAADAFLADVKTLGDVISLATTESPDTANVTTSKRGFSLSITPVTAMPARQAASLRVETGDVDAASATLQAALLQAGGRVIDASTATDPAGQSIAHVTLEAPLAKAADLLAAAKSLGTVRAVSSTQNPAAPSGNLAKARLDVTFATTGPIVSEDGGLLANIRHGLSISARGLVFSAKMIVVGLCFVLPWAVVLWAGLKIFRRRRSTAS